RCSPIVDDKFIAGAENIIRANRNAECRFVGNGGAVAKQCSAKPLKFGFIHRGLCIKIAQGRQVAKRILFLQWAFFSLRLARTRLAVHSPLATLHSLLSHGALALRALRKRQLIVLLTTLLSHLLIDLLAGLLA